MDEEEDISALTDAEIRAERVKTYSGSPKDIGLLAELNLRQTERLLSSNKNPLWKRPEIIIPCLVAIAIAIIGWIYFTPKPSTAIQTVAPFSRGADFLTVKMNPTSKLLSITNDDSSSTTLSIYDVSFQVGDITIDKYNHEMVPDSLGSKTDISTLGFATTTRIYLEPNQERDFDTSTFPFVVYDSWSSSNPNRDYDNFYCFFVDAKNNNGQESFYPVITSKLRFISGFDNPRPQNSGVGGGYSSEIASKNIQNQMEDECQSLYNGVN